MPSLVTACALLSLAASVHSHLGDNFAPCSKFFYKDTAPQGLDSNNRAHICQRYENSYYFATLYDTARRIPVYSAYVFTGTGSNRPNKHWLVEPQLVNPQWEQNMMSADSVIFHHPETNVNKIGTRQATNDDYKTLAKQYNRGHLNPSSHHQDDSSRATFALTNVVAQNDKLNRRAWSLYEQRFTTYCGTNKAFVLVGAVPSANNLVNERVNIPDYLWHAYCCVDQNSKPVKSGAAAAKNTGENKLAECSLQNLQTFLTNLGQGTVNLFNECNAPPQTTGDCTSVIR